MGGAGGQRGVVTGKGYGGDGRDLGGDRIDSVRMPYPIPPPMPESLTQGFSDFHQQFCRHLCLLGEASIRLVYCWLNSEREEEQEANLFKVTVICGG